MVNIGIIGTGVSIRTYFNTFKRLEGVKNNIPFFIRSKPAVEYIRNNIK